MKFILSNLCEICKQPKGRFFNHDKCSKIKQAQHARDKRPYHDPHPNKSTQDYLSKTGLP